MPVRDWFRPPRHLLALFVALIIVPGGALGWFAWRTLEQDRALERQRVEERLQAAADVVTAALQRRLAELSEQLPSLAAAEPRTMPEGSLLLIFRGNTIRAYPPGRLLYLPAVKAGEEPPPATFATGEMLEFRKGDLDAASDAYRRLTVSRNAAVRAAALVRRARVLRKQGRFAQALRAYDELGQLSAFVVAGAPAELLARHSRCVVLSQMKAAGLEPEAEALYAGLQRAVWPLDRAGYEFYSGEARAWLRAAAAPPPSPEALVLAEGVERFAALRESAPRPLRGSAAAWVRNHPLVFAWNVTSDSTVAFIAGRAWLQTLSGAWKSQGVSAELVDGESRVLLANAGAMPRPVVTRSAADTGLPWTLRIASADPARDSESFAARRRLVVAGLIFVAFLVVAGSGLVGRALSRELAVARLQSDFVAAVSHEFRSPLTSMRHLTQMLEDGAVASEDRRRQYYRVLARESERLQRLVENLLNFGRMEAGKVEYRFEELDAAALVAQIVADFQRELPPGRLIFEPPEGSLGVRADREAMTRAVWNLLDNAAKYSPESEPVTVDVHVRAATVAIGVKDRGLGIPESERREIFKKFYRGAGTQKAGIKGTGIGLSMVEQVVQAHNGQVRVESEPGRGSTFTIVLPLRGANAETPRPRSAIV